ncbi:AAA family ATPase [Epibacterium sp. MM17-32]|uniref:AAA family ATPase n=1 Tax=Epibacterium sp. MM17-32 TaxID=2917734 RepID=UPI001EF5663D|nr:AAA family ATPase [Epibacterium sp. MM17-32]MCG7630593.1 AAA family ATPase [Epibacterium sp. MM17-32]
MKITRVQVEEGFLDGLDLRFESGLNAIIGARGTGKTSVVELIRFAVGSSAGFQSDSDEAEKHARAVLGAGQVTVTMQKDNGDVVVSSRASHEETNKANADFVKPIVFSQTEIETLGQSAKGRLDLIDQFIPEKMRLVERETEMKSQIASMTAEIGYKSKNLRTLQEEWSALPQLQKQLSEIEEREASVKETSELMKERYDRLNEINQKISQTAVAEDQLKRFLDVSGRKVTGLIELESSWQNLMDPAMFHGDLTPGIELVAKAMSSINSAKENLRDADTFFRERLTETERQRVSHESEARSIRLEIEKAEIGFGEISRRAQRLRDQVAQLQSLSSLVEQEAISISKLQHSRGTLLDQLLEARKTRFEQRKSVAETLNKRLAPNIKVVVEHGAQTTQYEQELANQLKGSGLRYTELLAPLANLVEPRELVEWTESNSYDQLAQALNVSVDRAIRLISAMEKTDLGRIAAYPISDAASFYLLDGGDEKQISNLSLGQRCTVVLPIVLQLSEPVVVLDQPEDHIDNAFIADTLIKSIRDRASKSQLIVTTHNANIPVLGEAQQVTLLDSDGRRGFVDFSVELDSDQAVDAISSLMEGGREAFGIRAAFYAGAN